MYEKDGVLYAENANPMIGVSSVRATDDYRLFLKFTTGEDGVYNAADLINSGVFTKLQDLSLFKQAYIDYDTVVWNDVLDISPEHLYENSLIKRH